MSVNQMQIAQASVCGAVVISDAVGSTMAHMKNFSPTMSKKMITIFEEAYPSRPKEMHILNMPGFVDSVFNMIKGFMKEKMRQRMQIHKKGDYSKLQEALGTEVLPIEYGGTNGSIDDIAGGFWLYDQAASFCDRIVFSWNWEKSPSC